MKPLRYQLFLLGFPVLLLGLASCGPTQVLPCGQIDASGRPTGAVNLGAGINTSGDDFAPWMTPDDTTTMYFTSNIGGWEDNYSVTMPPQALTRKRTSAESRAILYRYISEATTNDGTVAFENEEQGFFACGHSPDTKAGADRPRISGIVGGTDLFQFNLGEGQGQAITNLGPDINSVFWDGHPAVGVKGQDVLLVFSSDRPVHSGPGFSSPFEFLKSPGKKDSIRKLGNADIYYVFRTEGSWGPVRNFSDVLGNAGVNSTADEYSPFLFCVSMHPTLLFASRRSGDFDIFKADLDIDFRNRELKVYEVTALPKGDCEINSKGREIFPFVPQPHERRGSFPLYYASDRDGQERQVDIESVALSYGGLDLYRSGIQLECKPPTITYRVMVRDGEEPSRPVKRPYVVYCINDGPPRKLEGRDQFEIEVSAGDKIRVWGGSDHDELNCREQTREISHYTFEHVVQDEPMLVDTLLLVPDTVKSEERSRIVKKKVTRERVVPVQEASVITDEEPCNITAVAFRSDSLVLTYEEIVPVPEIIPGSIRLSQRQMKIRKSVPMSHVEHVRTANSPLLCDYDKENPRPQTSVGTAEQSFAVHMPANYRDTTITDTVTVLPRYFNYPPCAWEFTPATEPYRRNVPYFQTNFWEVNTAKNLPTHLSRLGSGDLADSYFIELHRANAYWGVRDWMSPLMKETRPARLARRRDEYRRFANLVSDNLHKMSTTITGTILPDFLPFLTNSKEGDQRLLIRIVAYSDVRPIIVGTFLNPTSVSYVSGHFDDVQRWFVTKPVSIASGTSMVGQDNDILSKLRAWYGYQEIISRLRENPLFEDLYSKGLVLLPTESHEEYQRRLATAKIIVLIEGRQVDPYKPDLDGYRGQPKDYYSLDSIRRVDVFVNRAQFMDRKVILHPPCCIPEKPGAVSEK